MTKHILNEYECGCKVVRESAGGFFVERCKMHEAAPELLYLCRKLTNLVEAKVWCTGEWTAGHMGLARETAAEARDVLAKAEDDEIPIPNTKGTWAMSKWTLLDNTLVWGSDGVIAECSSKERAEQIVREHNAHEALLAACGLADDLLGAIPEIPNHEGSALSMRQQLRKAIELAE